MALDANQQDAYAYLRDLLDGYGLGSLAQWAFDHLVSGTGKAQVAQLLRERPEYKQRFRVNAVRKSQGLPELSPEEIIGYERQARQLFQSVGLPAGFYDSPDDFVDLLGRDKSIAEISTDLNDGFLRVTQAPKEVRDAFSKYFGASGDSALAAFFLDPEKATPVLVRAAQQAVIGGTGLRFGFDLNADEAGRLVDVGVDGASAQSGFQKVNELRPLFEETIGEQDDYTAGNEGVGAVFGVDSTSETKLRKRLEQRSADSSGSGGAAASSTGTGLGAAA